jgi:hypothetical protein
MTIEKAFAIEAEPSAIWEALWADVASGNDESFVLEGSQWPAWLALQVRLGSIPCRLTYRIKQQSGHCEVSALLEPTGFRYSLSLFLTFGHIRRNFEMLLVQGLANLKDSVEDNGLNPDDDPDWTLVADSR